MASEELGVPNDKAMIRQMLIVLQMLDEQAADVRAALYPGVRHATFHELRLVMHAVYETSLRGRALTASAISRRTGLSRATVGRRLTLLLHMGHIEQAGRTYKPAPDRWNDPALHAFMERTVNRILATAAKLTRK